MSEVRRVVVVGSGIEAWVAAAGLRRAFPSRPLEVHIVPTSTDHACIGRWSLPSQRGIHAILGINEAALLAQTGATFKLATEHLGWQGEGSRYLHAHGEIGTDIGGTPFYKFIQSEALAGRVHRPEAFSLAGSAARLGRFARPMGEGRALTNGFTYGFHLEEEACAQFLAAHASRLGVRESSATFAAARLAESGEIAAVQLKDGTELVADYFFDCSGFSAKLIDCVSRNEREDWSAWLPCDRMLSAMGPRAEHPPAITQTFAVAAGWRWRAPLAAKTMVGIVYSSAHLDDASAHADLRAFAPGSSAEPLLTRFSAGRRRRFWVRNCVAFGQAAMALEPLAGAELHFAQLGLATFLELFPLDPASTIESGEYNRVLAQHADALRDFTLAHYLAGTPRRGELWDAIRAVPPPQRLADKLDLYAAIGRIALLDHETFEETDWAWLLMGAGPVPNALELQIRLQLERLPVQKVHALRDQVRQLAESMPPHSEYLRQVVARAMG